MALLLCLLGIMPAQADSDSAKALESNQSALLSEPVAGSAADESAKRDRIFAYLDRNLVERAALLQQFHRPPGGWSSNTDPQQLRLLGALEAFNHRALDQAVLPPQPEDSALARFRRLLIGAAARIHQDRKVEAGRMLAKAAQIPLPGGSPAAQTQTVLAAWAELSPKSAKEAADNARLRVNRDALLALKAAREAPAPTVLSEPVPVSGPCLLDEAGNRPRLALPDSARAESLRPLLAQAGIAVLPATGGRCAGRVLSHPLLEPGLVGGWIHQRLADVPTEQRLLVVADQPSQAQRAILEALGPVTARLTFKRADQDFMTALDRRLDAARAVILVGDLAMIAQVVPLLRYLGHQPRIVTGYLDARNAALIRPEDLQPVEHPCADRRTSGPCLHTPAEFVRAFARDLARLVDPSDDRLSGQWGEYRIDERRIELTPRWVGPQIRKPR
ncbi:MAG: hypothetical protein ACP5DC_10175 [Halothiobacillaceae bacterium]